MSIRPPPPPPPKRGPAPRKAASQPATDIQSGSITTRLVSLRVGGVASKAQMLLAHKDTMNDVKIALLSCDDTMRTMRGTLPMLSGGKAADDVAVEALQFTVKTRRAIDSDEMEQDRAHNAMPEMGRVKSEIALAKQRGPAQWQQQQQPQRYDTPAASSLPSIHSMPSSSPPGVYSMYNTPPPPQAAGPQYGQYAQMPGPAFQASTAMGTPQYNPQPQYAIPQPNAAGPYYGTPGTAGVYAQAMQSGPYGMPTNNNVPFRY